MVIGTALEGEGNKLPVLYDPAPHRLRVPQEASLSKSLRRAVSAVAIVAARPSARRRSDPAGFLRSLTLPSVAVVAFVLSACTSHTQDITGVWKLHGHSPYGLTGVVFKADHTGEYDGTRTQAFTWSDTGNNVVRIITDKARDWKVSIDADGHLLIADADSPSSSQVFDRVK
jgi:hypothetical protein